MGKMRMDVQEKTVAVLILIIGFWQSLGAETFLGKLTGVDFFTGYGYAKVNEQADYHSYPLLVDFSFAIPRNHPESRLQFQLEPLIAYASQPSSNAEVGGSFFLKYRVLTGKFQPYLKVGSGIIYLSQDFQEQATNFNFASSLAVGFSCLVQKEWGVALEARYRHVSNAGFKEPNSGVDSRIFLLGLTHPL